MEAFSLLKYWRNGAAGSGGGPDGIASSSISNGAATILRTSYNSTTATVTAVSSLASETDEEQVNDDDGPFFDLDFAVPEEKEALQRSKSGETDDEDAAESDSDENDVKFTLSSCSSGDGMDPNVSISPSDDLVFNGQLVQIEHSSKELNGLENNNRLQLSFMRSATKFKLMMLKLKNLKSNVPENDELKTVKNGKDENLESEKDGVEQNKLFTVKFKANEVPITPSLFVRDNSSKNLTSNKPQKENIEESTISDEKKFSKETVQRYLKKVKPLYIRVSKRYGEKLKLPGAAKNGIVAPPCTAGEKSAPLLRRNEKEVTPEIKEATVESNAKNTEKQGNIPTGLRVVYKHLGKSRSASFPAVTAAPPREVSSKRRDDSLLQQQDGIQGAILHCKRSFIDSRECSILERSVSAESSLGDKEKCR